MRNFFLLFVAILSLSLGSCNSKKKASADTEISKGHKVVAIDVLQANAYTYIYVAENGREQWIAVTKMNAQIGETYYYADFLEMNNFESKDLDRIFESVYFIQNISTEPIKAAPKKQMPANHMGQSKKQTTAQSQDLIIQSPAGSITIAELFGNKKKYKNEKISIKGKVVKANFGIMGKNWFHLQDGTSADGSYDLTITSMEEAVKVGDILTFKGTIALDKDFGSGYNYAVLLEDAEIVVMQ